MLRTVQSMGVTLETIESEISHLAKERRAFLLAAGKEDRVVVEEKLRTTGIHLVNGEKGYLTCSENGERGERVKMPDSYIILFPRELAEAIVDKSVLSSLLNSEIRSEWVLYVANAAQFNQESVLKWDVIYRRICSVLDTMLQYITVDPRGRHLETIRTLIFFLEHLSDDDVKISLEYCLKGENSLWERIEQRSHKEKLIVRDRRGNEL